MGDRGLMALSKESKDALKKEIAEVKRKREPVTNRIREVEDQLVALKKERDSYNDQINKIQSDFDNG